MNTTEKLEQSSIVKEKGTQYFKVCLEEACFFITLILAWILLKFVKSNRLIFEVEPIQDGCHSQLSFRWFHDSTLNKLELKGKACKLTHITSSFSAKEKKMCNSLWIYCQWYKNNV